MIEGYLLVAVGGAMGTLARFWVAATVANLTGPAFPWGTLIINVVGSFIIGIVFSHSRIGVTPHIDQNFAIFLSVGICGGFTTFSSYSLQILDLARGKRIFSGFVYMIGSVILGMIAVWLGSKS